MSQMTLFFVINYFICFSFIMQMPLDLVARSRAMDGSADLKWRNADHSLAYNIGGPRSGAQGRSLDWKSNSGKELNGSRSVITKFDN